MMVIDAASYNFVPESNHASTSFTPTREQVGTSHASQLEDIGVTGFEENVDNETFQSNQFWDVLKAADEPPMGRL